MLLWSLQNYVFSDVMYGICSTGACAVVEEVMLQEAFNLPTTQILSLYALGSYLATRPQLTVSETAAAATQEVL